MHGQDLHWSQQEFAILQNSPAMIGVFEGSARFIGQYRDQWSSVPVAYQTYALSFDKKTQTLKGFETAVGLRLAKDRAGDAGLSWTQMEALASASKQLNSIWKMSLGLGFSAGQRAFDVQKLTFKSQWDGSAYNENLTTGEDFNRSSGLVPALQIGLGLHHKNEDTRTEAHLFAGGHNINRPKVSFKDAPTSKLNPRITIGGWGVLQIHEKYDWVLGSFFQIQGKYQETLINTAFRYHLGVNGDNPTFVELGTRYRLGDAIIPSLRIDWNAWSIGWSYDYNQSPFEVATNGRGGFEMAVQYRIVPVQPIPVKKACPIF